jgi:hypothetical protein
MGDFWFTLVIIHPFIHPSIHPSISQVMVCWWLLVHSCPANGTLFCGQEDLVNSNMGRARRKKKVGWFERFSLRYCGQQKQEFRAGMKNFISSSKENNQTNKQTNKQSF